jgi:hypothetical protein
MEHDQIISTVDWLIDDWCEVRKLKALRHILAAYPMNGTMAQDWGRLRDGLQSVQSECAEELSVDEKATLKDLLASVERLAAH